ncbi:MAG: site-specific integrase, partial [Hyphomicrobium sp.]
SEPEIAAVWHASRDMGDYGVIVRLLILTGQRKCEIADLVWSEIDFVKDQIDLPGARTKNSRPHVIPLSTRAAATLAGVPERNGRDFVFGEGGKGFQGWSKSKLILDTKLPADMPPWCLHDLRRSVVTALNENGLAAPHVIEALVNHVSGHKASIAGVYNKAVYAAEKREASQAWGEHVSALVAR